MINLEEFPTNPVAKEMMAMISPIYDKSYVGKWIFQVMGLGLGQAKERILSLYQEAFPGTAYLTISLWEQQYGLTPTPDMSLEARRMAILERIQSQHPINPSWLANEIYEACMGETTILENTGPNKFTVLISEGDRGVRFNDLIELIDKHKPAHLSYDFVYKINRNHGISFGCTVKEFKKMSTTEIPEADPLLGINWYVDELDELLIDEFGNMLMVEEGYL